jgi:glycosyltransferase involved in cell wall biosynthesis
MYLYLFKEIGLQVTFLPNDFQKIEPYTTILQQKGIEVLYGDWYQNNIENWLKNNLKYFNFVYLERPEIGLRYIDLIRQHFSKKIFYFPHDIHHIRLSREYNITHDEKTLNQSKIIKKIEMDIFSKVDIIHVVGNYEYQILKEKFNKKIIRNIPIYIYDKQLTNVEKDFSKRKDLIFVGGFSHNPNKDGVLWFSQYVYPKIVNKFQDIIWHIVGSNMPDEIIKLESKNIKIEGLLSDEDLYSLYQKCRIAIVPLRFGAGVKGKIVEAAYNQIPIVTTSIGGEGLDNSLGAFIIEDDAEKMSEIIIRLYEDYSKLKKMSDSGKIFIEKYFSINRAKEVIMKDIN